MVMEIRGVIPPLVTPFDSRGELDERSLTRLIEHVLQAGVHGIFALGSTGEMAALTLDERLRVVDVVVRTCARRVPVLVGITETSTRRAVELGKRMASLGIDAVVVAPPYYHQNSQAELVRHFREIAGSLGLPVVAYNVPSLVKTAIEPRTVELLAREGTIVGLKDSGGDMVAFRQCLLRTRELPGFRVLTGMELLVDAALQMGAHGCVPGLGNVAPREYVRLYEAALRGDWETARRVQERLVRLFEICYQGTPDMSYASAALSGFKSALRWLGILASAGMAGPWSTLPYDSEARVREVLIREGFLAGQ